MPYCVHPFRQVAVKKFRDGKPRNFAPCCNVEPQKRWGLPSVDPTPLELFNSDPMVSLRESFIKGERPSVCDVCWKREDSGLQSFRVEEPVIEEPELNTLDITISNVCNIACRMCSPTNSALLMKDQKYWEKNNIEFDFMRPHWHESMSQESKSSNFFKYILDNTDKFTMIKCTGGEPFYDKTAIAIIDKYIETGDCKNTTICFTTNGTCFSNEIIDKINQFKKAEIEISCDGVFDVYDYIRHGTDFMEFIGNINRFKINNTNQEQMQYSFVIQAFNLSSFETMVNILGDEARYSIFPVGPEDRGTHPKYLPVDYLRWVKDNVKENHEAKRSFRDYLDYWIENNEENLPKLKREVELFDKSRNQHYSDFLDPKLTSYIDSVDPL